MLILAPVDQRFVPPRRMAGCEWEDNQCLCDRNQGSKKKIGRSRGDLASADLAFVTEFSFYRSVNILSIRQRIRSETPFGSIDGTVHDRRTARCSPSLHFDRN